MSPKHDHVNDEDIIRRLNEYETDYLPIDRDRLVLYAISLLEKNKIEPTLDKITATTFKIFPKRFHLIGFPEYPDGLTIYTCFWLHNTKGKKWLTGSVQSGFKITERGRYFLTETIKMLQGRIKSTKIQTTVPRRKELTFINQLKKTDVYKKFASGEKEKLSNVEILEAIKVRPSDSKEIIEKYLKKYLEYANRISDSKAIEFLDFIKNKLGGKENGT